MGQISEITSQTNAGTQEGAMSVSYLAELAEQLRASVSTFRLPERANEMLDALPPNMAGVPALPGGGAEEFCQQQEMGINAGWNQGFSSDFLSLPQPQESSNSGSLQFAFSNQQDFGAQQQHFPGKAQYAGQQPFVGQQYGSGNPAGFDGQQFGNQTGFNGPQYGNKPGLDGPQLLRHPSSVQILR